MHRKEFEDLIRREVKFLIDSQYRKNRRKCPQCGTFFKRSNKGHFFCSRICYSRYHRIPGMVRKMLKGWD